MPVLGMMSLWGQEIPCHPILPHLPGKQVSRNPSPLLRKRVPLTQGTGSRQEGSPAVRVAPLCAAAGVAVRPTPPRTPQSPELWPSHHLPSAPSPTARRLLARLSQGRGFPETPGSLTHRLTPCWGMLRGRAAAPGALQPRGGWRGTGVHVARERVPVNTQTQGTPRDREGEQPRSHACVTEPPRGLRQPHGPLFPWYTRDAAERGQGHPMTCPEGASGRLPKPLCLVGPWPCGSWQGGQGAQHSIVRSR